MTTSDGPADCGQPSRPGDSVPPQVADGCAQPVSARLAVACGAIFLLTIGIVVGVWAAALRLGGREDAAVLAAVAAGIAWTVLAGPVLAAGASGRLAGLFAAGMAADGTGGALLVLAGLSPMMSLADAVRIYLVVLAVMLACWSVVALAKGPINRQRLGVASALAGMLVLGCPFWIGGLLASLGSPAAGQVAAAAVAANPFYAAGAVLNDQTHFVWHLAPRMYELTRLGTDVAVAPARWAHTMLLYLAIAALLSGLTWLRGRCRSQRTA